MTVKRFNLRQTPARRRREAEQRGRKANIGQFAGLGQAACEPDKAACELYGAELEYARRRIYYVNHEAWGPEYPVLSAVRQTKSEWKIKTREKDGAVEVWAVVDEDYVRPRWSAKWDQFDTGHVDAQKVQVNVKWLDVLSQYPRPERRLVYLDTPVGLTTGMLRAAGYTQDQLHTPNYAPQFKKRASDMLRTGATIYAGMTLYEWLRDQGQGEWDLGADYCCTFEGNGVVRPQADLSLVMARGLLAKSHGVLWCTFARRLYGKSGSKTAYHNRINKWVRKTGGEFGYRLKLVTSGFYRRMVYFMWVSVA